VRHEDDFGNGTLDLSNDDSGGATAETPDRPGAGLERLFPLVYDELRLVAHRHLGRGPATLTTTELVHEVYLKLLEGRAVAWQDRVHFFALASRAMRFILVDRARTRSAAKRGGPGGPVTLTDGAAVGEDRSADLVAIDEALDRLAGHSPRLAELVQYRFFGGMSYEEIAEVTGLSVPTAKRDWARARTWLLRFMDDGQAQAPAARPSS
jgi:RNA polymerase sigma factor (TIGR02999 family)